MAALTTQTATTAGITPSYASCAGGGDTFTNTGNEIIHVKNGHSSPQTVTIVAGTFRGETITSRAVAVTNAEERMIGPFDPAIFGTTVSLTYSGVTSLTVGVFRVNRLG